MDDDFSDTSSPDSFDSPADTTFDTSSVDVADDSAPDVTADESADTTEEAIPEFTEDEAPAETSEPADEPEMTDDGVLDEQPTESAEEEAEQPEALEEAAGSDAQESEEAPVTENDDNTITIDENGEFSGGPFEDRSEYICEIQHNELEQLENARDLAMAERNAEHGNANIGDSGLDAVAALSDSKATRDDLKGIDAYYDNMREYLVASGHKEDYTENFGAAFRNDARR